MAKDSKLKEKVENMEKELNLSSEQDAISALVSTAEKLEYTFSKDDVEKYTSGHEMSDDMLEMVSGGVGACVIVGAGDKDSGNACFIIGCTNSPDSKDTCWCFVGGGGTH